MSRVLTFSRTYPSYHPKAGQPTHFVEKIWKSLYVNGQCPDELNDYINRYEHDMHVELLRHQGFAKYNDISPKIHTIRAGNRWKVGDKFSPRVWYGQPYKSHQIVIGPDIEMKKVWSIEIWPVKKVIIEGKEYGRLFPITDSVEALAKNDGLTAADFRDWFRNSGRFEGQIICWNKDIEYVTTMEQVNARLKG